MDDNLHLSLPERGPRQGGARTQRALVLLLCAVLLIGIANLAVSLYRLRQSNAGRTRGGDLPAAQLEDLALRLEKQGLGDSAVQTWQEYLDRAGADPAKQAKIWYRIGKLRQEANSYEQALAAYYRSESLAKVPELASEISRRIQESLEAMGSFAALRYELADRVGIKGNGAKSGGDVVLAEIGTEKITKADVDAYLEQMIENQLSTLASFLPEDQRTARKEELLKRYSTAADRQRLLNQLVVEEILNRQAGEEKLLDDPAVRRTVQEAQRAILARQVLDRELADKISITHSDLQAFYEAHKQDYKDKKEDKVLSFEEARQKVYQDLRAQKEKEVQEALLDRLKDRYQVVVHTSQLQQDKDETKAETKAAPTPAATTGSSTP